MNPALRTSSRLAAVQAHYELDLVGSDAAEVAAAFVGRRWNQAATAEAAPSDERAEAAMDEAFFTDLMDGVIREKAAIDDSIKETLSKPEGFERLETLIRAILRVAAYEFGYRIDIPVRVVIKEYQTLARDFFDGPQIKLIDGVLDGLAHKHRVIGFDAEKQTR